MPLKIWNRDELKQETDVFTERADSMSFKFIAKQIIERQKFGKDTILIVIGERRAGKSNWMLKLIKAYIILRREEDPDFKWSWKENFAMTTSKALEKYENLPERSFLVCDEAVDIVDRGSAVTRYQKQLKKLMAKIGQKKILSIFVIPEIFWLTTSILNMSTMLVAIAHRYQFRWSYAFYYSKINNVFVKDKFMLNHIEKMFKSQKGLLKRESKYAERTVKLKHETVVEKYPIGLFGDLKRIPTFVAMHRFGFADRYFEERYIKNVKMLQMKNVEEEYDFVPRLKYSKLLWNYNTLLYNLRMKAGMNFKEMENLHIDKDGNLLTGAGKISTTISRLDAQFAQNLSQQYADVEAEKNEKKLDTEMIKQDLEFEQAEKLLQDKEAEETKESEQDEDKKVEENKNRDEEEVDENDDFDEYDNPPKDL